MTTKKPPCIQKGCYNRSTFASRCDEHQFESFQSNRKERLPDDWRELRAFVLSRDGYRCYLCGSDEPAADGVDHLDALNGSNHHPTNLAAVHHHSGPRCHMKKTAAEGNQMKALNKPMEFGTTIANEYRRRQGLPPF